MPNAAAERDAAGRDAEGGGRPPLLCRAGDEQDARAKLSRFAHDFMSPDKRNTSGAYQGSMYFAFEGKILEELRKEREE